MPDSITAYQGLAGDRNDLGFPGALSLAKALTQRTGLPLATVGQHGPVLNSNWRVELAAAREDLSKLGDRLLGQLSAGNRPITVLNRCAASIATIPAVVTRHPDVCVVWFDAHADLNTPESSRSGYLGGLALSAPAGLWDSGFGGDLPLANIVLVGSRDLDPFEAELVASQAVRRVTVDTPNIAEAILQAVAGRPVYVHLDCDVLEPGLVPTDFRVEGGLSLGSLHEAFTALATAALIGLEISEFQYSWEVGSEAASPINLINAMQPVVNALLEQQTRPIQQPSI